MAQSKNGRSLIGSTYADIQRSNGKYPIVLRFKSIFPKDVAGILKHAARTIGDTSHCDEQRQHLNRVLVGNNDIAKKIVAEEIEMRENNFLSNCEGVRKSRGSKEAIWLASQGAKNPWLENVNSGPPLREIIVTVHRDFCRAEENCPSESVLEFLDDKGEIARFDLRKCDEFAGQSLAFMQKEFGEMLKYCRVDMDEQSVHLHGLLYEIIKEKPTARFAEGKSLFRCTHHPLIQSHRDPETGKTGYERAQDAIGEWFEDPARSHLNIVRGEPRAAAFREAIEQGEQARAELQERIDAAPLIEKPIPPGSKNAQIIYAIRRLAETAEGKKLRKDAKQKMAIEMLVVGGFVSHEEQKEAKNRDLRDALLKGKEEEFGSVDDIISNPDALIAKLESQASDQKQRERHLEEKKKEQDARERKLQDWEILQKQRLLQIDQQAEEKLTQAEKKAERIRAGAELSAREKLRKADLLLEDAARKRDDAKNKRDEAETMLVVIEGMVDGHIRYGRTEKGEGFSIPADADKAQSEHIIGHIRRKPKAANRIGQRMGSMLGRLTKSFDDRADAAMEWIRRREAEFAQAYGRLSEFVKALAFERNEEKARKIANKLGVLVGLNSIYNALNHGKTWKRDEEER